MLSIWLSSCWDFHEHQGAFFDAFSFGRNKGGKGIVLNGFNHGGLKARILVVAIPNFGEIDTTFFVDPHVNEEDEGAFFINGLLNVGVNLFDVLSEGVPALHGLRSARLHPPVGVLF